MCLVPVKLRKAYPALLQSYLGDAFHLPPSSRSELPSEPHDITDAAAHGDYLDIGYLIDDLKVHQMYPRERPWLQAIL
jgi:hypothetical protein